MNILITAVSGPTAIGIIRCLKKEENIILFGTDIVASSIGKKWCKKVFLVSKHTEKEKYYSELEKIINENKIDMVIPTLQEELPLLQKLGQNMKKYVAIVKGHPLENLLNKKKIYEEMKNIGLEDYIPIYSTFLSKSELIEQLNKYFKKEEYVCFKNIQGHGGKGFFVATSNKEYYLSKLRENLNLHYLQDVIQSYEGLTEETMVSEYIQGEEISVDVLRYQEKFISVVPRIRTRVSTGIVINGKTIKNEKIINIARKIVEGFNLEGFINMQFIYTDDRIVLIDLNPRFCGSQVMSYASGVNFPKLICDIALNKKINPIEPKWEIETKRYWEAVFFDDKGNII